MCHNVSILQEGHTFSTTANTGAVNIFPTDWWGNWVSLWLCKLLRTTQPFIFLFVSTRKIPMLRSPCSNLFLCHVFSLNTWYGRWPGKKHHVATAIPSSNKGPRMTDGGLKWVTGDTLPIISIVRIYPKILPHACSSSFITVLWPCYSRCTPEHQYHLGNCEKCIISGHTPELLNSFPGDLNTFPQDVRRLSQI